jgi:hypothetical protein
VLSPAGHAPKTIVLTSSEVFNISWHVSWLNQNVGDSEVIARAAEAGHANGLLHVALEVTR